MDWAKNRFWVPSPKTEHHDGHEGRWVPIFPELLPHLEEGFDLAEPGTVYVIEPQPTRLLIAINSHSVGVLLRSLASRVTARLMSRGYYCFDSVIENSPLRTRAARPSTNFATASSP